jgi:hypothetical protein
MTMMTQRRGGWRVLLHESYIVYEEADRLREAEYAHIRKWSNP